MARLVRFACNDRMSHVDPQARSYDAVPYESKPLQPTHPDHLAVMARLAGLTPPDPASCRVLEIGCATGGNLMPMALSLPGATFVGIDVSPEQIAAGERVRGELQLGNVELLAGSIVDAAFAAGSFDYVVCHGVYSWVPEVVQQSILATCARVLSPRGVAYVSYNTYPGWHLRSMMRDMLLFHARGSDDPQQRIRQSREFVDFLQRTSGADDSAFARFLGEEAQLLARASDTYVFHEHLETDNRPVHFREFVARASGHGLRFLTEAVDDEHVARRAEVAAFLDQHATDPIERGQYVDFLQNRTFRRSMLCHAAAPVDAEVAGDVLASLWLGSAMRPERADADCHGEAIETFVGPGNLKLSIAHPWLKLAFASLGRRWPEFVPFATLAEEVARERGAAPAADELQEIFGALHECHRGSVLKLQPHAGVACRQAGSRPSASPLARWMAQTTHRVSSLRHELVELREVDRLVLLLLDGTRDRGALAVALRRAAEAASVPLPGGAEVELTQSLMVLGMAGMLLRSH
jgi:SAM-dependent methyltransferase/methyltransferase-like protein